MRHRRLLLALIMLTGLIFRLLCSSVPRMHLDEGWDYDLCLHPVGQILGWLVKDQHPPLAHLALHFCLQWLPHDEFILRLPWALLGTAAIALVYLLGRDLMGVEVGLGAAFVSAISFPAWEYDTFLRNYNVLTWFALLSTWTWWRLLQERRPVWMLAYVAASAALLYSNYQGGLVLAAHAVYSLGHRDRLKTVALCWVGVGLLYIPWLPTLALQLERRLHMQMSAPPAPSLGMWAFLQFAGLETGLGTLPALLGRADLVIPLDILTTLLFIGVGVLAWRSSPPPRGVIALLLWPAPLLMLAVIKYSLLGWPRFYAFLVPYVGMVLAAGLRRHPRVALGVAAMLLAVNGWTLASYLQSPFLRGGAWNDVAVFCARHTRDAHALAAYDPYCLHVLDYYYARDMVQYNVSDPAAPTYDFVPRYRELGGLPQLRLAAAEPIAEPFLLVLWNCPYDDPVRAFYATHYRVQDELHAANNTVEGRADVYLLVK